MAKKVFVAAYILSIVIMAAGLALRIMKDELGDILMVSAAIITLVYILIGIYEVYRSGLIPSSEKMMWTAGFLFLSSLTGLLYLISGRAKVVDKKPMTNMQGIHPI